MHEIRSILVYVPGQAGEAAPQAQAAVLALTERLAAASAAEVEIVDVVDELPLPLRTPTFGYPALSNTLEAETFTRLEEAAKQVRSAKVAVSVKALYGKDFIEITKEALRGGHDLVLLHGSGNGGASTSMRLFRTCPAPVWSVGEASADGRNRVLAAVDPLFSPDPENQLNQRILNAAKTVAETTDAELHVVFAWGETVEPHQLLQNYRDQVEEAANEALTELLAPYSSVLAPDGVHLVPGRPAAAIQQVVEQQGIDLLVMGTVVRTGLQGFFIGNTAEELLSEVDCSILALKPEGFRSPVTLDS